MRSLADVPLDVYVRVSELRHSPAVSHRLRELGLREETVVRCLHRGYGNLICEVASARVGLNDELAQHIMVTAQVQ